MIKEKTLRYFSVGFAIGMVLAVITMFFAVVS